MEIEQTFYNALICEGVFPSKRILEVGCGEGRAAEYLHHAADVLYLLDISNEAINKVIRRFNTINNIKVYNCDIFKMTGTFDLIYYFLSLHHIYNPKEQLIHARSLLASDGNLVVCEFYSPEGTKFHIHDIVFKDAYTPEDLRLLLLESGFLIKNQRQVGVIHHNNSIFSVHLIHGILP